MLWNFSFVIIISYNNNWILSNINYIFVKGLEMERRILMEVVVVWAEDIKLYKCILELFVSAAQSPGQASCSSRYNQQVWPQFSSVDTGYYQPTTGEPKKIFIPKWNSKIYKWISHIPFPFEWLLQLVHTYYKISDPCGL